MGIFKKKKKEFVLIDFNKNGKGVSKDDETLSGPPYTLKRGTRLFFNHFWRLVSINLFAFAVIVPIVLIVVFYITGPKTPVQETIIYGPLAGASVFTGHNSPSIELLLDFHAHEGGLPIWTLGKLIKVAIPFIFLLVTFGWVNCGITYLIRSIINGDPVFIWSDFFYAIKKNLKQGMLVGMLDVAVITALVVDYLYFSAETGVFWNDLMFFLILAIAVLYIFMRFYIYLIVITFDMKTTKILKNSFFFSILGIKRNIMAVLCVAGYVACFFLLYLLLGYFNIGVTAWVCCLLTIFAASTFICSYSAYPVILKYMVIRQDEENVALNAN